MSENSEAAHLHADNALKTPDERDRVRSGGLPHFVRSDTSTLESRGELSRLGITEDNFVAAMINDSIVVVSSRKAADNAFYKQVQAYCHL
ncbi:MAG: hypothetical protein NT076_05385 [Candidatus Pacearchaeota archaeon]|nr:hypothetical protein [Candidatus Pacearchaeota archaeon]